MFVRITTVDGTADLDGSVRLIRDKVVPALRQQNGFEGLTVAADRSSGTVTVMALWASEADLAASESAADKVRDETVRAMGGARPTVERYEQAVWEAGVSPPAPGARVHIRETRSDPARIDDDVAFFRDTVVPDVRARPGFRGVRLLVDRRSGEGRVGTVWADDESLRSSLDESERRRAAAAERGIEFVSDRTMELVFASMAS